MTIFRDFQRPRPRRDIGIARPRHSKTCLETETLKNVSRGILMRFYAHILFLYHDKTTDWPGGPAFPIYMLNPPINKLTLLKRAAFGLNFKLWPPIIRAWPPKSTALQPALRWRKLKVQGNSIFLVIERINDLKRSPPDAAKIRARKISIWRTRLRWLTRSVFRGGALCHAPLFLIMPVSKKEQN